MVRAMLFPDKLTEELFTGVISQPPEKADCIIWLQGDRLDRGPKVVELYNADWAKKILITGNNVLVGHGPREGENDIDLGEIHHWLIQQGVPEKGIIIDNQSMNCHEQAKNVISIAKKNDWHVILIVASPYHQVRAFLTFLKQVNEQNWPGKLVNQTANNLDWSVKPGGRDKSASQCWQDELGKMRKYKKNLATMQQGLAFLK